MKVQTRAYRTSFADGASRVRSTSVTLAATGSHYPRDHVLARVDQRRRNSDEQDRRLQDVHVDVPT